MSETSAWSRFWFARVPSDTLAIIRIFLGVSCVLRFTGLYGFANRAAQGKMSLGLPVHRFGASSWRFDDVRVPVVDALPGLTLDQYQSLEAVCLVLGASFCIGLGARVVGPLLGACLVWMQLFDQAAFKHHMWTLGIACLVVGFAHCNDRFSVDALLMKRPRPPERSILPLRMLQTMVSAIYLFSTLAKLNPSWFSGFLFRWTANNGQTQVELLEQLRHSAVADAWWLVASWLTLVMESFLVVGFWRARWRPWAIATGWLLHAGIELALDVGSYSSTMLALYIAFLAPATRTTLVRFDPSRPSSRRAAWLVRAFDWTARFRLVPGVVPVTAPGALLELESTTGAWKRTGWRAISSILRRTPVVQPLGLVLDTVLDRRARRVVVDSGLG